MAGSLILILGDQLSHDISSLKQAIRKSDVILMAEVWDEATYARHHKKKIAFIFSAMRHFAQELRSDGLSFTQNLTMKEMRVPFLAKSAGR
jgi:deoxyribodipyrimidine photolyase-related protein